MISIGRIAILLRKRPFWERTPPPKMKYRNAPHNILQVLVDDWRLHTIDKSNVEDAMETVRLTTAGAAGRDNPICLMALPSKRVLPDGNGVWPEECGKQVSVDNHSIQEHGVLDKIATASKGGAPQHVLHFVPTPSRLANLTKAPDGHPGSRWWWKIDRVPPEPVRGCRQNGGRVVNCWKWGECGRWGYDGSAPAPRYDR